VLPKLPRLPASEVISALKRLGFEILRQKGSHVVMRRSFIGSEGGQSSATCVVPLHRRDLAVGTLASVLRQAGVDVDAFLEAL
jgi:predicted RNA binding protein YcfA (HicA-like mRNA interferase family)